MYVIFTKFYLRIYWNISITEDIWIYYCFSLCNLPYFIIMISIEQFRSWIGSFNYTLQLSLRNIYQTYYYKANCLELWSCILFYLYQNMSICYLFQNSTLQFKKKFVRVMENLLNLFPRFAKLYSLRQIRSKPVFDLLKKVPQKFKILYSLVLWKWSARDRLHTNFP